MNQKISTQTAILLGSVIIAVGVFLGLRGKNEPPPPPPPQPAQMPIAQAPAPPPPATPQVDRSAVEKEVQAALGKQKKALTDKCLAPSLAKQPEPKNRKMVVQFHVRRERQADRPRREGGPRDVAGRRHPMRERYADRGLGVTARSKRVRGSAPRAALTSAQGEQR